MQSKSVLGVVLAFGVAFALLSGSGIGAAIFGETPGDDPTTDSLEEIREDASVDEDGGGLDADVAGNDEPTVIGVAISAGQFGVQLVAAVALLPLTLVRLGFPQYFAIPIGGVAQVIAFLGLAQFVSGREWI